MIEAEASEAEHAVLKPVRVEAHMTDSVLTVASALPRRGHCRRRACQRADHACLPGAWKGAGPSLRAPWLQPDP